MSSLRDSLKPRPRDGDSKCSTVSVLHHTYPLLPRALRQSLEQQTATSEVFTRYLKLTGRVGAGIPDHAGERNSHLPREIRSVCSFTKVEAERRALRITTILAAVDVDAKQIAEYRKALARERQARRRRGQRMARPTPLTRSKQAVGKTGGFTCHLLQTQAAKFSPNSRDAVETKTVTQR